ncbi:hypothetical protein GCM10027047_07290 [Rhodococcus aerolatus]
MTSSPPPTGTDPAGPPPAPAAVRRAGVVVLLQGAAALVFAVSIAFSTASDPGASARSGYGTAGYFAVMGVGIVLAGASLVRGRRAARAPAVVVQVLLLGAAWYLLVGSGQALAGVVMGLVAVAVLVLLLGRATSEWVAGQYRPPMA